MSFIIASQKGFTEFMYGDVRTPYIMNHSKYTSFDLEEATRARGDISPCKTRDRHGVIG